MKKEDIRLYNESMELVGIFSDFIGANWEIKFSEFGTGEIELAKTDDLLEILMENEHLFLVQGDIQSVVTGISIGKKCTIYTRTLEWLLQKFFVKELTGTTRNELIMSAFEALPQAFNLSLVLPETDVEMEIVKEEINDIYTVVKKVLKDERNGFSLKADFKEKAFIFSLLTAKENGGVLLCDAYKTAYDSEYMRDIQQKADGAWYYHKLKYMGRYDAENNSPYLAKGAEHYGTYYVVSGAGKRFGLTLQNGDILACKNSDGSFEKIDEAKPFLVEIPKENDGIFSWSAILSSDNSQDAQAEFADKKRLGMLNLKTGLTYGTDYKLGDIITTKFYAKSRAVTAKKLVSGVQLWTERGGKGACPTMTDLNKEDENVI